MRRKLPKGVRMYTGDDFNFAELIEGDAQGYSDALLGIFDSIAPAASQALVFSCRKRTSASTTKSWRRRFRSRATSSRRRRASIRPGVVFMAWLNGHQEHFVMVGGQQSARHVLHFSELFRLADAAGLLADPELACRAHEAAPGGAWSLGSSATASARSPTGFRGFPRGVGRVLRFAGAGVQESEIHARRQFLAFARQLGRPEPHVIDQFHHPGARRHPDPVERAEGRPADRPGRRRHVLPHRLLVPRRAGARDDAVFDPGAEGRRRHAVRQSVRGLRRPFSRHEKLDRESGCAAPLRQPRRPRQALAHRRLGADRGAGAEDGVGAPPGGAQASCHRAQGAVRGVGQLVRHRGHARR